MGCPRPAKGAIGDAKRYSTACFADAASRAALDAGGVINDHHGVGMRLAPDLESQFGAAGMGLLRRIKAALDPDQLLCPGKLALREA